MGHRHRSSRLNLLKKERHSTPLAPQHVPKAYDHKARLAILRQTLDEQLCRTFRGSHDTRGVDSLIRRDENKTLDSKAYSCLGHYACATDIIFHCFARIQFHEWHVLMRRGMEDDLGLILCQNSTYPLRIGHIANDTVDTEGAITIC